MALSHTNFIDARNSNFNKIIGDQVNMVFSVCTSDQTFGLLADHDAHFRWPGHPRET
jgi:hypothetical protein